VIRDPDVDLFVEIAQLVEKYGPETFDRLAERLDDDEFIDAIRSALGTAGKAREAQLLLTKGKRKRQQNGHSTVRSQLAKLEDADPAKAVLLRELYDGLMAKRLLATNRLLNFFCANHGLPEIRSRDRASAVSALVESLIDFPLNDLRRLVNDAEREARPDNRSLSAWTDIILQRKDPGASNAPCEGVQ
jgi:hypothetical protein